MLLNEPKPASDQIHAILHLTQFMKMLPEGLQALGNPNPGNSLQRVRSIIKGVEEKTDLLLGSKREEIY